MDNNNNISWVYIHTDKAFEAAFYIFFIFRLSGKIVSSRIPKEIVKFIILTMCTHRLGDFICFIFSNFIHFCVANRRSLVDTNNYRQKTEKCQSKFHSNTLDKENIFWGYYDNF